MIHSQFIPMKPVTKGRPRMTRRGRVYTPATTLAAESIINQAYNGPLFTGNLTIVCRFTALGVHLMLTESQDQSKPKLRGDGDNYAKLVLDAIQGKAFLNDRQVTVLIVVKQ